MNTFSAAIKICRATSFGTFSRRLSSYPRHELVGMPSLSPTMTAGTVGSWGKKVGDKCSPGESVAEIETDKASMAYEAQDEFYIAKLLIDAGVEVPVGSPMMVTVEEESFIAAFADYVPPAMEATAAAVITSPTIAAPVIEKVLAPPVLAVAPVVATPVIVAPPKAVPTQAPKVDVLIPVIQSSIPAAAQILSGSYSVNWSKGAVARSAIANKLSKDQQAYILRYGRSGQKPLSA